MDDSYIDFLLGKREDLMRESDRWNKIADATKLIKPISRYARDQASYCSRAAEVHRKMVDLDSRIRHLEETRQTE